MNNDEKLREREQERKRVVEMVSRQRTVNAKVAQIEWQIRRNEALIRAKELERDRIIEDLRANMNAINRAAHGHCEYKSKK